MPDHDFAVIVASTGALFRLEQSLLRLLFGDVAFVQDGDKPPRRGVWIKAFQSHRCPPSYFFPAPRRRSEGSQSKISPLLQILRVLDHLFAFRQLHVGFLPVAPVPFGLPTAAHLAVKI